MRENKKITHIYFWTRLPHSVERIKTVDINFDKDKITCNHQEIDSTKIKNLITTLFDTCDINHTEEEYRAFFYENDFTDYNLRFFLTIYFENCTYLAVKGIRPFQQPHFKDILNAFQPFYSIS